MGNQVKLRLRDKYSWREEGPGDLSLVGVDTGGGPVKLNGDKGIVVAKVVDDLPEHSVTAEASASEQLIYHDEPMGNTSIPPVDAASMSSTTSATWTPSPSIATHPLSSPRVLIPTIFKGPALSRHAFPSSRVISMSVLLSTRIL